MSFAFAPVHELSTTSSVGIEGRCRVELTEHGERVLHARYAEVHGTASRNTHRSICDLFQRGHEYVFTFRQLFAYFGTDIAPIEGSGGDDLFVGNTFILVPSTDVILLNGE